MAAALDSQTSKQEEVTVEGKNGTSVLIPSEKKDVEAESTESTKKRKFESITDDTAEEKGPEVYDYDFLGKWNEMLQSFSKKREKRKAEDPLYAAHNAARKKAKALNATAEETKQMVLQANSEWLARFFEAKRKENEEWEKLEEQYVDEACKALDDISIFNRKEIERYRQESIEFRRDLDDLERRGKQFDQRFERLKNENTILFEKLGWIRKHPV